MFDSPSLIHFLWVTGLSSNEPFDENSSVVRIFFWEEVATLDRLPLHLRSPLPPYAKRTAIFCIVSVKPTTFRPQVQHRAFNFFRRFLVGAIMFDIDRSGGSIFFANSMHTGWVLIRGNVLFQNFRAEGSFAEGIMEGGLRSAEQITLRQRLFLRQ